VAVASSLAAQQIDGTALFAGARCANGASPLPLGLVGGYAWCAFHTTPLLRLEHMGIADVSFATKSFRTSRARWTWTWLWALSLEACIFDVDVRTVSAPEGADAGSQGDSMAGPARHKSCAQPLPQVMPAPPEVFVDHTGRPSFDLFHDFNCDAPGHTVYAGDEVLACMASADESCTLCLQTEAGQPGMCAESSVDECLPRSVVLSFGDGGACHLCVRPDFKANACCEGRPGVDCRSWPYPGDSKPHQVCARHEDCMPGLVCGETRRGYGLCVCPGMDAYKQANGEECWYP
jgi:hypothetical protein